MATSRRSRLVPSDLQELPLQRRSGRTRRAVIATVALAALLGLAWFDGGEEPLRPIAQPVDLPEQAQ